LGPPGWLVGSVAAIAALVILGFDFALFTSGFGFLMATVAAFCFGAGIAALIDPKRQKQNAMIVAFSIVVCLAAYLSVVTSMPAPPGTSYGGPNVYPPGPSR
jgi:tetrahydromethanopterin S-methyltransferase subunit D